MAKTLALFLTTAAVVEGLQSVTQGLDLKINNFGFRLLYNTQSEIESNSVVSTYGVWALMASVAQGAQESSYAQLAKALHLPLNKNDLNELLDNSKICLEQILIPSNDVFLNDGRFIFTDDVYVKQDFKDSVHFRFNTLTVTLQFNKFYKSAASANDRIEHATRGKIPQVVLPSDFYETKKGTKMILVNAVSFKGLWKMPFDAKRTELESFYNERGIKIGEVKMMKKTANFYYNDIDSIGAHVIEVPYGNDDRFTMVIMNPKTGRTVKELCNRLNTVSFKEIYSELILFRPQFVTLWLPRFKITTKVALDIPLMKLGVFNIFNSSRANFRNLSDSSIFVSEVLHKAEIEVTETGPEDLSPLDVLVDTGFVKYFAAHKPFLYVIVEKISSVVLFGGVYSNPSVF